MPSSLPFLAQPAEEVQPARLTLVARRPRRFSDPVPWFSPSWCLTRWHLLSLDAPSVAALWVVFLGWCAGVPLSFYDPIAMFVAVWMLYVADRLLDARPLAVASPNALHTISHSAFPELEQRHRFHHRHRHILLPCLMAATLLLALLLHRLAAPVLHLYAMLASLLAGWLLLVHARASPSSGTRRLPKELAVGLFFPAAVFIPTVARTSALHAALLLPALLFAGLCTLNCLLLYAWEHPHNRESAHASTRLALRCLLPLTLCFALSAWGLTIYEAVFHTGAPSSTPLPHAVVIPCATALSTTLLLLLHARRRYLEPLTLRALADLVLLTPAPLMCLVLLVGRHA